jgi:hypothetical protein
VAEHSYERAVQVLKERIGARHESGDTEGRDDFRRALEEGLGISRGDADELIDALIDSGQLRYHREGAIGGVFPAAPASGMGGAPAGSGTGGIGAIPAVPAALGPGYWQIGSGESSGGAEPLVREGQVDPTR